MSGDPPGFLIGSPFASSGASIGTAASGQGLANASGIGSSAIWTGIRARLHLLTAIVAQSINRLRKRLQQPDILETMRERNSSIMGNAEASGRLDSTRDSAFQAGSSGSRQFPTLLSPFRIRMSSFETGLFFNRILRRWVNLRACRLMHTSPTMKKRARGGVGLIVFESQAVHPSGKMSRRFVEAWDRKVIPMFTKITEAVHSHGARIFSQLTHGGHTSA